MPKFNLWHFQAHSKDSKFQAQALPATAHLEAKSEKLIIHISKNILITIHIVLLSDLLF